MHSGSPDALFAAISQSSNEVTQGWMRVLANAPAAAAALPWGESPNVVPCMSWRTCHRVFLVMAHAKSGAEDWRAYPLETSASGAVWSSEFPAGQVS